MHKKLTRRQAIKIVSGTLLFSFVFICFHLHVLLFGLLKVIKLFLGAVLQAVIQTRSKLCGSVDVAPRLSNTYKSGLVCCDRCSF